MNRRLLVVVLASVWIAGCGGKVDEDPPTVAGADAGADGATGGGQAGAGGGSSGCALPPGRPEYPHCYPSLGGTCLEPSETTKLLEKLPALSGQKITGPWVARMEDACTPACCYGPLHASSPPRLRPDRRQRCFPRRGERR